MNDPIVLERVYDAPASRLWTALTDPEEMRQWYFDIPGFRAETGFEFSFNGGPEEGPVFVHLCRVVEAIPNKKLSYTWRYEGYPGDSLVTFEFLDAGEDKTLLRLTHSGLETLSPHHEGFKRENFVGGWTHFVEKGLPEYLAK